MSNYITCEGCQRLIDLYPPPQRSNQQMWPSPMVIDTTVIIDGGRFCAECGKSRLLGKDIVKGYRVDDGGVAVYSQNLVSPELANKTFRVASGVNEVSISELDDVANGAKSGQVELAEQPELKFEEGK